MKTLVITGSPHKNGTTALLANEFIAGAEEAGGQVVRFDAAFKNVHPCIACEKCHSGNGGCVFKDDMERLNPELLEADAVVFISPIYYYGMSAQIKSVIDRFYANDAALHSAKKCALLLAFADETDESAEGAIASYKGMTNFLGWRSVGIVAAKGCTVPDYIKNTSYLKQARELGKKFK